MKRNIVGQAYMRSVYNLDRDWLQSRTDPVFETARVSNSRCRQCPIETRKCRTMDSKDRRETQGQWRKVGVKSDQAYQLTSAHLSVLGIF